jgi:quinol-cytochrome oxidoreductase complex cytochrome b subunit
MNLNNITKKILLEINNFYELAKHVFGYPVPINLNYWWSFGFIAGFFFIFQIFTGIFLSMHYSTDAELAFDSVEYIMREIHNGWFFRYCHSNGASFIFLSLYIHMAKGMFYKSYAFPRMYVWWSGLAIFLLTMASAFIGYVLPWGQMSLWGATVICNLFSTIPYVGEHIVRWLWGGFSVDYTTLNRFFSLHYILPLIALGLLGVHIALLHKKGSSNPNGVSGNYFVNFYPYYLSKDLFVLNIVLIAFSYVVFIEPNMLGHPDNYIKANPLVTPTHIVPEWYFLPFYAILRAVPNKTLGVLAMGASILMFALLPFVDISKTRSPEYRPVYQMFFWFFVFNFIHLGYLGGCPAEYPYVGMSQNLTAFHFAYFLVILPCLGYLENRTLWDFKTIKKK